MVVPIFVLENQAPKRASFDKKMRKRMRKTFLEEEETFAKQEKPNADKRNRRRHRTKSLSKRTRDSAICHSSK